MKKFFKKVSAFFSYPYLVILIGWLVLLLFSVFWGYLKGSGRSDEASFGCGLSICWCSHIIAFGIDALVEMHKKKSTPDEK